MFLIRDTCHCRLLEIPGGGINNMDSIQRLHSSLFADGAPNMDSNLYNNLDCRDSPKKGLPNLLETALSGLNTKGNRFLCQRALFVDPWKTKTLNPAALCTQYLGTQMVGTFN